MSHPGGGRNDIPNRFKRHFFTFNMPPPSTTAIDNIYGSMLRGRYADNDEFTELVDPMTAATIQLWQKVKTKMLPTPAKFHYVFNMRDLSRVFQGVLHAPMEVLDSTRKVLALWKHECCRVFSDKLISLEDKKWFDNTLESVIKEKFGESVQTELKPEIFYADCMRDDVIDPETDQIVEEAPKIYGSLFANRALQDLCSPFPFLSFSWSPTVALLLRRIHSGHGVDARAYGRVPQ